MLNDNPKARERLLEDYLDELDPPPATVRDVIARTGWNNVRAGHVLREWRNRHGLAIHGNGHLVRDTVMRQLGDF